MSTNSESSYLTSDNVEEESACRVEDFPLPHKPSMKARIQQLPVALLRRLNKALHKGTPSEQEQAERDLIQKSVVNADGSPVYNDQKIAALKSCNAILYASLVQVVGKANQRTQEDVDAEVNDLEKN